MKASIFVRATGRNRVILAALALAWAIAGVSDKLRRTWPYWARSRAGLGMHG